MIPDIDEILSMLVKGQCTQAEASAWFNTHMGLAAGRDDGLRDHFAAQALSGWLASFGPGNAPTDLGEMAVYCYQIADAMLKARAA